MSAIVAMPIGLAASVVINVYTQYIEYLMKIGFEGKRAVCNATGLGNYSRLVIDELSTFFPQHEYLVYSPKGDDQHRLTDLLKRGNVSLRLPEGIPLGRKLWRSVKGLSAQAERDGVDILHGLSAQLPLDASKYAFKSVVTVHDLIYCHFPQFYGPFNTAIYKFKCRSACQAADRVVAVSECTKRDLMKFFSIPAEKIDVVYQGCSPLFSAPVSGEVVREVKARYSLPDRFLLNVGTIEERKNILLAVKALEMIDDKEIPLIIVGRMTKYANLVDDYARQHGLSHRVCFLNNVSSDSLPALYNLATAFIYPSRYEGFGIPIIEAQSCGAPVIAATGSCLEEAAGPDALFVHPDAVDEMVEALNRLLNDEALRQSLIKRGKDNAKRFELKALAEQMMNVYQKVLNA